MDQQFWLGVLSSGLLCVALWFLHGHLVTASEQSVRKTAAAVLENEKFATLSERVKILVDYFNSIELRKMQEQQAMQGGGNPSAAAAAAMNTPPMNNNIAQRGGVQRPVAAANPAPSDGKTSGTVVVE